MKPHEQDIVCPNPKCGKMFEEPLLLNDLSKKPVEHYYVCPHCIIKLDNLSVEKQESSSQVPVKPPEPPERLKETNSTECAHHFGYLKNHPKNEPMPDECLTCSKLLQCLLKR